MENFYYFSALFLVILIFLVIRNFSKIELKKTKIKFNEKRYKIFYQDSKSSDENIITNRLLVSKKYGLKGKPDFILRHNKKDLYIPIELKSGNIKDEIEPHLGDFLQLITYFILIEDEFGKKPKYGKLIYNDYMFIVPNTNKYKKQLLMTLKDMRALLKTGQADNCSTSFIKCKNCLCNNTVCEVNKNG